MTTTASSTAPWADQPFTLIPLPFKRDDLPNKEHSSVFAASQMAQVHNFFIRALNSIVLQAPHIPTSSSPQYDQKLVEDLLKYTGIWVETLDKHHHIEETFIFPEIEKFAGQPGLLEGPKHQHDTFTPGVKKLGAYTKETKPEDYRWEGGMKEIIDGFGDHLHKHLLAEIEAFLDLRNLDDAGLRDCWDRGEKYSQSEGFVQMLFTTFPLILGNCDKTYQGGTDFPPVPGLMPYVVKYCFAAGNSVWRFNPCDFWGNPRPLQFIPENKL